MDIHVDTDADEETARVIATAVAEHLGRPVEIVDESGGRVAADEDEWTESGALVTEREEQIREEIQEIMEGGPERGHDKIEDLGKMFVRDRLDMLFDEVAYEDGTFARHTDDDTLSADGLLTGVGRIDGRDVFFTANDYTVKAGSLGQMGVEKEIRLSERAAEAGAPIVRLIDSTGARLSADEREEGDTHMDRYRGGKMFYNQCLHSGQIPQIGVLYGPDIAGSAYTPVFCDFLIMVDDISGMAIASPRIVEAMTGESTDMDGLGGPEVHAKHSGSADLVVPDEETAVEAVKQLLSYLPQKYDEPNPRQEPQPPIKNPKGLDQVIPDDPNVAYDVHEVIDRVVDRESFFETKAEFAPEIVTGFARMGGRPVGIVANQPEHVSGAIFPDSAEKAAEFIWTCDAYEIPLVYLCDTPGFMVGSKVEKEGILQRGRKFIYATSNAQVPKFCVITRKAYGAGIYAMCGPSFGPDATLALPSAEISVMGPDAAVHALFGGQLEEMEGEAREAFIESAKQEFEKYVDVRKQASKMQVDELLPAGDLREQLLARLSAFENKRRRDPDRHHGTILF
ncbi:acyl-CoA carboxylase subunit beta [Halorientalis litorea]|uniref:acyl-CoA carboxylase subunit beta n=1 Tax=Halorientalis litorea TaxID=2931977 RepID=UPI001FF3039E|nr:acyl-CoA carboxylase subunit beta [Halorientalis litorea]